MRIHQLFRHSSVIGSRSEEPDRALVRRCLEGEPRCFELLVERYQKVLYNVAFRMLGDPEDALDVAQTALLKAYEKLADYDPRHKFFSWVYRIAVNESLNVARKQRNHEPLPEGLEEPAKGPMEQYDEKQLKERISEAILRLPPDYRQVVVLRHYGELSYREIAEALGIPEKTVKSRLFSARRQLADLLVPRGAQR
jgi:RNA polymerase sigma-70 factor (ECF subfamily)